jgi:hypothetical protein
MSDSVMKKKYILVDGTSQDQEIDKKELMQAAKGE